MLSMPLHFHAQHFQLFFDFCFQSCDFFIVLFQLLIYFCKIDFFFLKGIDVTGDVQVVVVLLNFLWRGKMCSTKA